MVFDLEWQPAESASASIDAAESKLTRAGVRSAANLRVFPADKRNLFHSITALSNRGVVALPTDTLYGEVTERVLSFLTPVPTWWLVTYTY